MVWSVVVFGAAVAGAAEAAGPEVSYVPPVDGPVIDAFRPPATAYGPGNRGLKYAARPGELVQASADGTVTFAGQVGGSLHVTVGHADGVRTSYSFLASVGVARGQRVRQGDPVGTAGHVVHFGARRGDAYIDPASLLGRPGGRVELVPFEVAPGAADDEVEPLRQIVLGDDGDSGRRGTGGDAGGSSADVVAWLRDTVATAPSQPRHPPPGGRVPAAVPVRAVTARLAEVTTSVVLALAP